MCDKNIRSCHSHEGSLWIHVLLTALSHYARYHLWCAAALTGRRHWAEIQHVTVGQLRLRLTNSSGCKVSLLGNQWYLMLLDGSNSNFSASAFRDIGRIVTPNSSSQSCRRCIVAVVTHRLTRSRRRGKYSSMTGDVVNGADTGE